MTKRRPSTEGGSDVLEALGVQVKKEPEDPSQPMPMAEVKKMHSVLAHLAKTGHPEAKQHYDSMNTTEKRKFFWCTWMLDPKLCNYRATKSSSTSSEDKFSQKEGWMSIEQIMALNDIYPSHPRWEDLSKAMVVDLQARPHERGALAALGEKQYFYKHHCHKTSVQTKKDRSVVVEEADIDNETFLAVQNFGGGSSASNLQDQPAPKKARARSPRKVQSAPPEHLLEFKEALRTARKLEKIVGGKVSDASMLAMQLENKLKGDTKQIIGEAYQTELKDKLQKFMQAQMEFLKHLSNNKAGNEEETRQQIKELKRAMETMELHVQAFTTFLKPIKEYLG